MTKLKQDRSRRSGYRGSLNAQDSPQTRARPLDVTLAHVRAARLEIGFHGSQLIDRGNLAEVTRQLDLFIDFLQAAGAEPWPPKI